MTKSKKITFIIEPETMVSYWVDKKLNVYSLGTKLKGTNGQIIKLIKKNNEAVIRRFLYNSKVPLNEINNLIKGKIL